MTHPWRNLLIGAVLVLSVWIGTCAADPLRRSDDEIAAKVLSETPLGTPMQEVKRRIEKKGWSIRTYSETAGFPDGRVNPATVTGVKHIRASLGNYTTFVQVLPLRANVTVYWGFDEKARLIDVWVWRTIDGL